MKRHIISGLAGAMVLVAAACHDDTPVAPTATLITNVPRGAVQAAIQQQAIASDGSITYVVRVMAKDVPLSSFQGAVTFAPGTFQLVSVASAQGRDDETHVLNPADFAAGRIRFAAFTPTTFAGADQGDGVEAFRFTVRAMKPLEGANLVATLDVVGKETGTQLAADRVFASPGVQNMAGHVLK